MLKFEIKKKFMRPIYNSIENKLWSMIFKKIKW
jgi:hypothetical protein